MKHFICTILAALAIAAPAADKKEEAGKVSARLAGLLLSTDPTLYKPEGYSGGKAYGGGKIIHYATATLWVNALECAHISGNTNLEARLIRFFEPYYAERKDVMNDYRHVDLAIIGAIPLEIAVLTGDERAKALGLGYAENQWAKPVEGLDWGDKWYDKIPFAERMAWWEKGFSPQTRLWIDDMYMITLLQTQAYRATHERKYIERSSREMCLYLERLQREDGLFNHAPGAPFAWGRGNGWMAAGMALVLDRLPEDSPHRARIMEGYRLMMATLLKYQRPDGLWCQLVDRPDDARNWGETSATAMFAYAYLVGIRHGWLDAATYGAAARKAWESLCARLDEHANLADVCEGTGKKDDLVYYYERGRVNGDPHGQAPMLWLCGELLKDRGATPETSPLFVRHVDDGSGVVSYVLRPGLVDHNQQSMYFTHKSMTDDGRFLVFWAAGDERLDLSIQVLREGDRFC